MWCAEGGVCGLAARLGLAAGLVMMSAVPASAVIRRHDRPDSMYLNYASESQFAGVGRMFYADGSGGDTWNGSGTLVAPNWVLTAAHVVDNGVPAADWAFDTGSGTERVRAAEVVIYPGYAGGGGWFDMALVRLDRAITNIEPVAIADTLTPNGTEVSLVGYGGTGQGLSGWDNGYDLQRRAGTNISESGRTLYGRSDIMAMDFDAPWADGGSTNLEGMLMFGDSGGAVMAETALGWAIVGVNSFISTDGDWPGQYGQYMGATRVFNYAAWINQTIPAPGAAWAMAAGGVLISRRRRAG